MDKNTKITKLTKLAKMEELICKYDGLTNTRQIRELIYFDCEEMLKKIIAIETNIAILKTKQRLMLTNMAKLYTDFNMININTNPDIEPGIEPNTDIYDDYSLSNKFIHFAKSYRIAKRNHKTNILYIIDILAIIKKYDNFLNNVDGLIRNKDYANAKELLYANLALYKSELTSLISEENGYATKKLNIFAKLNNKADKLINILKCH